MENGESYLEFITSENYKQQIDIWHKAYNISREKTELFYDFVVSLYELIDDTYLGSDVIISEEDQRNHFNWCWDKTIENFNKEKIYFKERGQHYQYFWNFFLEAYYFVQLDGEEPKDIATADLFFISKIGLQEHLSPTRANGLLGMVKRLKIEAIKHISAAS